MKSAPRTTAERQRDYIKRLDAAGKTKMLLIVPKSFARQVHELAHANVMAPGELLAKALASLQETDALASNMQETLT